MEQVVFHCPQCKGKLKIGAGSLGRQLPCLYCNAIVTVQEDPEVPLAPGEKAKVPRSVMTFAILSIVVGTVYLFFQPIGLTLNRRTEIGIEVISPAPVQLGIPPFSFALGFELDGPTEQKVNVVTAPMLWQWLQAVARPMMGLVLVVSGICLLRARRWARSVLMWYGCVAVALGIVGWGITIWVAARNINELPLAGERYGFASLIWGSIFDVLGMVFPMLLVWFMSKPAAVKACRVEGW